ncbi:MAG: hypothetical protein R8G66_06390 [Cytophagales bacterium]|nr:hypothetical protein [Cytophagales bacterium]
MKKKILFGFATLTMVAIMSLNYNMGAQSKDQFNTVNLFQLKEASAAICQEMATGMDVCCEFGAGGCNNGLSSRYQDGPYYYN